MAENTSQETKPTARPGTPIPPNHSTPALNRAVTAATNNTATTGTQTATRPIRKRSRASEKQLQRKQRIDRLIASYRDKHLPNRNNAGASQSLALEPRKILDLDGPCLETMIKDMAAEHIRLEEKVEALQAQNTQLDTRNEKLNTRVLELLDAVHIERTNHAATALHAATDRRDLEFEIDFLRRQLASTGYADLRSHRTVSVWAGVTIDTSNMATGPQAAQAAPWQPVIEDEGVDHNDLYQDGMEAYVANGIMPAPYWAPG